MSSFQETEKPAKPSIFKRALALLVLALVAVLAAKLLFGVFMAILWVVVAVAALIAVLWALKTLL